MMSILDIFRKIKYDTPRELLPIFVKMKNDIKGKKLADEALSHRTIGNFTEAHSLLKKSLEKYNYTPAMILVSTTLILQKKFNEAIKWIHNCLKILDDNNSDIKIELFANLGLIYLHNLKDYNKALTAYLEALSINLPERIDEKVFELMKSNIHRDLAWVYFYLNDLKNSYKYCKLRLDVISDCEQTLKLKTYLNEYKHKRDQGAEVITQNKYGSESGKVISEDNGRHIIQADDNADFISSLMSMMIIFSNDISEADKKVFSTWAELPIDIWSNKHQELFAHTLLYYFHQLKNSDKINQLSSSISGAIKQLPPEFNPKIHKQMTNEIIKIFNNLFGM